MKKNKGYTLVEIIVVIGIIAMLSTIVMAATSAARLKARDQARLTDLNTMYRFLGTAGGASIASYWPSGIPDEGDLNVFISAIQSQAGANPFSQAPRDPRAATAAESGYRYRYNNGNLVIYANLEKKDTAASLPFNEPTPAGGRGVLVGTGAWSVGVNGTDRYYQVSN